jgi:hypothetical protein
MSDQAFLERVPTVICPNGYGIAFAQPPGRNFICHRDLVHDSSYQIPNISLGRHILLPVCTMFTTLPLTGPHASTL